MGPWMDGCVPDSSRYVPGLRAAQVSAVVAPAATSVANDCTRGPCGGGVFVTPAAPIHVLDWIAWGGLGTAVAEFPSPPPTCPTIMIEVGTVFPFANDRLFVRLIVRPPLAPVGTVITTGDQLVATARKLASEDWKVQVTVPSLVVPVVAHGGAAVPLVPAIVTTCTFWLVSTTS